MFFSLGDNPKKTREMDSQIRALQASKQTVNLATTPPLDIIPAKLTSYVSGRYAWTEQTFDTTGTRVDKVGGRTGLTTWLPAKSFNGSILTTFPVQVWLIRTIQTDTYSVVYEILEFGLTDQEEIELDYVSKICVTKNSGVVTNLDIEHKTVRMMGVQLSALTNCTTGDDDCCASLTVDTACCDNIPYRLTLTVTATGDYSYFNGLKVCFQYDPIASLNTSVSCWLPVEANRTIDDINSTNLSFGVVQQEFVFLSPSTGGNYRPQRLTIRGFGCTGAGSWGGWAWGFGLPIAATPIIKFELTSGTLVNYDCDHSDNGNPTESCSPFSLTSNTLENLGCDDYGNYLSTITTNGTMSYVIAPFVDGDCNNPDNDPPPDGECCNYATDLTGYISGSGDIMTGYGDVVTFVYNASGYLSSTKFQWYADITGFGDTYRFYFGCLDGVYYLGYTTSGTNPFDESACFTGFTAESTYYYKAFSSYSCTDGTLASMTLTAIGGGSCDGTLSISVFAP